MAFSEWSVSFDGVDEYADAGNTYDFDRTSTFSISYWVRADPAVGSEFPVAKGASGTPQGWWSMIRSDGKVVFGMVNTLTTNDLRVRADSVNLRDGQWHHVVATHDGTGTAAGVNHIIDGVLATAVTESNTLTSTISNAATLRFATRENGYPSESLAGNLDEIAFYNKALSVAEAQAIFNTGTPLDLKGLSTGPNLLGWWRMGDGDTFPTLLNQVAVPAIYPTIPDASGMVTNYSPLTTSIQFNNDTVDERADFGSAVYPLNQTTPVSMGAWIKTSSGSDQYVILRSQAASGNIKGRGLVIRPPTGIWQYETDNLGNSGYQRVVLPSGAVNDGAWHLIAFTWSGSGIVQFYFDGVEVTNGFSSGAPIPVASFRPSSSMDALWVSGCLNYLLAYVGGFLGNICHSFVYSKALSGAEMQQLYGLGSPQDLSLVGPVANLVHWSALGDGDALGAGGVKDLSGLGHNGTFANGESGDFVLDVPTGPEIRAYNDGTMTNMAPADIAAVSPGGVSTHSCNFAGSPSKTVRCNTFSAPWKHTTPFSISFWIKVGNPGHSSGVWRRTKGDGVNYVVIEIGGTDPNAYILFTVAFNMGALSQAQWGLTIRDNNWHHIVCTYDGGGVSTSTRIYLDGSLRGIGYMGGPLSSITTITQMVEWVSYDLFGYMDEAALYSKAISLAEVQWVYNSGVPRLLTDGGAPSNLVGWWRMGEGGLVNATMINMEAGDIVNQAPGLIKQAEANLVGDASVTALGGYLLQASAALEGDSSMTGSLMGDVEIAADLVAGSSVAAAASASYGAEASVEGDSNVLGNVIVRVPEIRRPYAGPLRTTEQAQRLAGYQPDRQPVVVLPKFTVEPGRRR